MSRKPTIKISYPDASDVAMKLTEAMVRRAPGRRVVETTSEDSASPAGGELFADFDACISTSVDLTLTLNSASMDYALETLIRPNLTADERKRILGEDASGDDLLSPAQAAEAPGQALDGSSSPDVPSAEQEAATQSGEQEERNYSYKTYALFGLILATIELLKKTKRDSPANTLLHYLAIAKEHLEKNSKDAEADFLHALHIGWSYAYISPQKKENASGLVDQVTKRLYNEDKIKPAADPSWDDVEAEARQMQAPAPKQSAAPLADEDKADQTDETDEAEPEQDGEIDPGLLDDVEDGCAPAGEVIGHDE